MMFLTMEILRVASFFLLFCGYSVFSFPSRPLNERSTELAWQAWLLVDDQNQHKQSLSENFPRRRITPKSVFIAPTFSPESLPACADGYRPDSMGRCIKIIKLDEEAHLEFLLEKLNAQFGNYDEIDEESQENVATSGPFQLNIPLNGPQEEPSKHLDIAILVAPTNANFGLDDLKTTTGATTNTLGNLNVEKQIPAHNEDNPPFGDATNYIKRKIEGFSPSTEKYNETTIISDTAPTTTLPYEILSTKGQELTETSTLVPSTLPIETTIAEDITITSQDALFFLQPSLSNSEHVQNGTRNVNDTPLVTSTDDHHNKATSNHSLITFLTNSTFVIDSSINLNNKPPSFNTNSGYYESTDLVPLENQYTTPASASLVRFPSDDQTTTVDYVKFPDQLSNMHILPQVRPPGGTLQPKIPPLNSGSLNHPLYQTIFKGYINPNGSSGSNLKGNEHFIFKDVTNLPSSLVSDPVNGNHDMHANYNQVFNHRNRDKNSNLWSIPSSWSQSSPKPIVLRFSRRSINSRHLLSQQFQTNTQKSQTFYREVPSEEFSYIFGLNKNYKQNPR